MKALPTSNTGPEWNNKLLKDLLFIKKHLRYPINKVTVVPLFFIVPLILLASITVAKNQYDFRHKNLLTLILLSWMLIFTPLIAFFRYLRILKFRSIPTPFFANENMELVRQFLTSQHLKYYSHPDAPELFQIVSRPIGGYKNDQREVMIFIADDKRVLINSHFTNQRFTLTPPSRNYKKMAKNFAAWMNTRRPDINDTTVAVQ